MLELNDPRWRTFNGGYKIPYDASILLRELEATDDGKRIDEILNEFWQELHHQGDVGVASYLTLPQLIRIAIKKKLNHPDILGLVATIEIQRHINNPKIPKQFKTEYESEIKEIMTLINLNQNENWDKTYTICALAAIAAVKKQIEIAEVIMELESDDLAEKFESFLENYDEFSDWLKSKKKPEPKKNWFKSLINKF